MVVGNFSDETITFLFFVDVSGLNVTLGLLMFLKMGLLAKEDPTRCALERSDPFVYPLVHVAIASRCKNLATCLAWILPLFHLLMGLLVSFVLTIERERLGTQGACDGTSIADAFLMVSCVEIGTRTVRTTELTQVRISLLTALSRRRRWNRSHARRS